jgi:hypothetical protein
VLRAFINPSSPTRKPQELHVLISGSVLISVPKQDRPANSSWRNDLYVYRSPSGRYFSA